MITFKHVDRDVYLVTNFKVMYTTLKNQQALVRPRRTAVFVKALLNLSPQSSAERFYLLVRNPFNRIESFYKSKFLKAERNRQWLAETRRERKWEASTELFFPYLNLDRTMSPSAISRRLVAVRFDEFISILPDVYMRNPHMTPQHLAMRLFRVPLRFERIFRMESDADLSALSARFEVDLGKRLNSTKHLGGPVTWTPESIATVESLYSRDFECFGYSRWS